MTEEARLYGIAESDASCTPEEALRELVDSLDDSIRFATLLEVERDLSTIRRISSALSVARRLVHPCTGY